MSKAMYHSINDNRYGVSRADFQNTLKQVNANNVVGLLKGYQEVSPKHKTLITDIFDETSDKLTVRKSAAETICNALLKRAENARVSQKTINQYKNDFSKEISSYWTMGVGNCDTDKLNKEINNLIGVIEAAEAGRRSGDTGNVIDETLGLMKNQVKEKTDALNQQLAQDGWCADLWEGIKWCVGSNNLDEKVKADLKQYEGYIKELQNAEKAGGESAFKAKFKDIFGVEYQPELIKGYNLKQKEYGVAAALTLLKEDFDEKFDSYTTKGIREYTVARNKYVNYLTDQMKQQGVTNMTAAEVADAAIADQLKSNGIAFKNATNEQKAEALQTILTKTQKQYETELKKYTNGRTLASMEDDLKNMSSGVFGNKHDIAFRVNDYIASQQQGGAYVNMAVKIAGAIAIGVATGGTGWAALGITAAGTTAISLGTDVTDRMSSEVGLQDGEIEDILKNAVIDGATVYAGGKLAKFVAMFKNANAFVQAGGKLTGQVGGDIAIGAAAEYGKTGEITLEGVVFSATFSATGNLVTLKQMRKAPDTHPTKPSGSKVLDKATSGNTKPPGGKLSEAKFSQAKAEVNEELNAGVSSERAAELFNEGNLLQSQNYVQGREIRQIVEDNVGVYDSPGLGKIDLAKETDLSRLKQCRNEIQQWQNSTRDKEALVKKIDARISELEAAPNIQGQQVNSEILDAMNNYTEKDVAAILTEERQGLGLNSHEASILDDNIKLLDTVEELNAMKDKLKSRTGCYMQGVDYASETIKKIDAKIAKIETHKADFKDVTSRIDDTVSAKKGLSSDDLATIRAYAGKCNSAEELQEIVTKMKDTKSFDGSKKLISDINNKIEILTAKAGEPEVVSVVREGKAAAVNADEVEVVSVVHEGKAAAVNAGEVEVVSVVANDAVELTSVTPIEQSQNFNRLHKISTDEVVMDGYRDGGRRLEFNNDGSLANNPKREIILVDRNKDTKLQAIISDVKKKTANMTDKEKAAFLQEYIYNISGGDKFNMEIHKAWKDLHTGEEVLLGDIINEASPVAVCRHRSLLYKILGDEVDLKVELQRGDFNNGHVDGGHAWNTVQFEDGTSAIYDAMQNRTSSITPGNVDDYAKYYFKIGDNKKPLYNNGLH